MLIGLAACTGLREGTERAATGDASSMLDAEPDAAQAGDAQATAAPCEERELRAGMVAAERPGGDCFQIDRTEVSRAQYAAFLASTADLPADAACTFKTGFSVPGEGECGAMRVSDDDALPVSCVDQCDAQAFCTAHDKTLCAEEFPAEAQDDPARSDWFAACSSNGTRDYPYGRSYDPTLCAGDESRCSDGCEPWSVTQGASCSTANGALNLSGNVAEWTSACRDITGADDTCRVRGGSASSSAMGLRCAAFEGVSRDTRRADIGFRCCAELPETGIRQSAAAAIPPSAIVDKGADLPALRAAMLAARQAEGDASYAVQPVSQPTAVSRRTARAGDAAVYRSTSKAGGVRTEYMNDSVRVSLQHVGAAPIGLKLASIARGAQRALSEDAIAVTAVHASGNRIEYTRGTGVTEWYVNGPLGLEQGFTLSTRPFEGDGPLRLAIASPGARKRMQAGAGQPPLHSSSESIALIGQDTTLRYGELYAHDALGRTLPTALSIDGEHIAIAVDDRQARYPIVIDPLVAIEHKLMRMDGARPNDHFGDGVAASGNTVAIGAPDDDTAGNDAGAVYVFVHAGGVWHQEAKLTPPNAVGGEQFGRKVALDGDTLLVSALGDNAATGAAHVFVRSDESWAHQQKLLAPDGVASDWFGHGVALEGNLALVSAYFNNEGGHTGAVYAFRRSLTSWSFDAKLPALPGVANFGGELVLSKGTALVRAGDRTFAFVLVDGTWVLQQELVPEVIGLSGALNAIALEGDLALVSGRNTDDARFITVFERRGARWTEIDRLVDPHPEEGNRSFGSAVAISGDVIAVMTPYIEDSSPHLYLYTRGGSAFELRSALPLPPTGYGDLVVLGDRVIMGLSYDDTVGEDAGSALVVTRHGGVFEVEARLDAVATPEFDNGFGAALAIDGDLAVVGASDDNDLGDRTGSAYVFSRKPEGWRQISKLYSSMPLPVSYFGEAVDVVGNTILIGESSGGASNGGVVYVFERDGDDVTEVAIVMAAETNGGDTFGAALAADGEHLVVGAFRKDESALSSQEGAAYVFVRDGAGYAEQAKLMPGDLTPYDRYGEHVAIDGDTAVVSAPCNDAPGNIRNVGATYVFQRSGVAWSQQAKLQDSALTSEFSCINTGYAALDLHENRLIVGITGTNVGAIESVGSARIFERTGVTWSLTSTLAHPDPAASEYVGIGYDVAIDGDFAIVGALHEAHVYEWSSNTWTWRTRLLPDMGGDFAGGQFGRAVALEGGRALIGSVYAVEEGSAHVFDLREALGEAEFCTADAQCASGSCVDGVCCDSACDSACESCAAAHKADGSPNGACGLRQAGTPCGSAPVSCVSRTERALAPTCSAAGACELQRFECTDGFACEDGVCVNSCDFAGSDDHALCADDYHCDDGACIEDRTVGDACSIDDQCTSNVCEGSVCLGSYGEACDAIACGQGFCVDGVCCNETCTGQCEACAEAGSLGACIAVDGAPRGGRSPCAGSALDDNVCAGTCDGATRESCAYPAAATVCEPASCDGAVLFPARVCDGAGQCGGDSTQICGAYACDAEESRCNSRCESRLDCAAGALCRLDVSECAFVPSVCIDNFTIELADGTQASCDGYVCSAGSCRERCRDDLDCALDFVCVGSACEPGARDDASVQDPDAGPVGGTSGNAGAGGAPNGQAGQSPEGVDNDPDASSGCGCSVPGAPTRSRALPGLLVALAFVLLRLRRTLGGNRAWMSYR